MRLEERRSAVVDMALEESGTTAHPRPEIFAGTSSSSTPQLTEKMRELTLSVGRVVKAKATVAHRRKQSTDVANLFASHREYDDMLVLDEIGMEPRHQISDEYGFGICPTPSQEDALERCAAQAKRQAEKWEPWPESKGHLPPHDRLKRLCRKGIPTNMRPWVWMKISGAFDRQKAAPADYYLQSVEAGRSSSSFAHQISLDAPRTFPNCPWIQSEVGQSSLRRVLLAFSNHNPEVGYCQGMNYVVGLLLLALGHDEEAAFWMLASLIDNDRGILYQDLYADSLAGCHVEMRSLQELIKIKLPRLSNHMERFSCDISLIATDWFLCLYSTSLPVETTLRVWDSLFLEGTKVLFRIALALLKMHEPALLITDNPGDLLRVVRKSVREEFDRDELMKVAFDGIGSLSMDRIRNLRKTQQKRVDNEFAIREMKANLRAAVKQGYVLTSEEAHILEGEDSFTENNSASPNRRPRWKGLVPGAGHWKDAISQESSYHEGKKNGE